MADARFYFVPHSGASTETVDFANDPLQGMGEEVLRSVGMSRSMEGPGSFLSLGARWLTTLSQPIMGNRNQAMQLRSMQAFLETGGVVGFSADHDKSVLAYATTNPVQGDTTLTLGARQGWNTSATLAAGDYVVVMGSLPEGHHEIKQVASFTGGGTTTITLDDPIVYDYTSSSSVAVFWARFLPYGVWPNDLRTRPPVISPDDRQHLWDFFLRLELARDVLDAANPSQQGAVMINNPSGGMAITPNEFRRTLNTKDPRNPYTGRPY